MKKELRERIYKEGIVVARYCDDAKPITDFDYCDEALYLYEGEFYLFEYATAQYCRMEKISAEKAVQWVNETFYGARADELTAEVQKA